VDTVTAVRRVPTTSIGAKTRHGLGVHDAGKIIQTHQTPPNCLPYRRFIRCYHGLGGCQTRPGLSRNEVLEAFLQDLQ
jgi:hypothetical protein